MRLSTAYSLLSLALIGVIATAASAQVDSNRLTAALVGKTVVPTVAIGYQATAPGNTCTVNGRACMFAAKTLIYPNGRELFRVESGLVHTDAAQYKTFKYGSEFKITKVELKGDYLGLEMPLSLEGIAPDPKFSATVKIMLSKDWQKVMTTDAVLDTVFKYLPTEEVIAKAEAERHAAAERLRAEQTAQAEQARIAAARAQAEATAKAEQARADAQAKAEALAAKRRAESEKKIAPGLLAKAKAGDGDAQYLVGMIYFKGGSGIEKDDAEAAHWFRLSAEQGNAKGENALGVSYEDGNGVRKDLAQAFIWLRKSADQGNPKAEYNLGNAYYNGWGVPRDLSQALDLYRKAAVQGYSDAEASLGYMYANGEADKQDYVQAALWDRKAAAQGNDAAQNNLGLLYEHGQGVTKDETIAKSWYKKAADQGNTQAQSNLTNLERTTKLALHPPQVTEEDAFAIFQACVFDYEAARINVVDGQFEQYDVYQKISRRYAMSKTDEQRALIIALVAIQAEVQFTDAKQGTYSKRFDGAGLADIAAREAVNGYRYSVWRFGIENYFRDNDKLHASVTKF